MTDDSSSIVISNDENDNAKETNLFSSDSSSTLEINRNTYIYTNDEIKDDLSEETVVVYSNYSSLDYAKSSNQSQQQNNIQKTTGPVYIPGPQGPQGPKGCRGPPGITPTTGADFIQEFQGCRGLNYL